MKLINGLSCIRCKPFVIFSVLLIGIFSVVVFEYVQQQKENIALADSIKLLQKFNNESNQKLLNYVSANWISADNKRLVSICTLTGYVTMETFFPRESVRYKIVGVEEIAGMFGFIKFKIEIPNSFNFAYLQVNKLFQVDNIISISYRPPVGGCESNLCIENYRLDSRPSITIPKQQ